MESSRALLRRTIREADKIFVEGGFHADDWRAFDEKIAEAFKAEDADAVAQLCERFLGRHARRCGRLAAGLK